MNLKQRFTALALAAALASGTLAIGAQAAFTDTTGHWAEEAIAAVAEKKLFQGTSETTFSPDIPMNRGMFVTVLGRFSESLGHKMDGSAVFSDVAADSYCASYVAWAADHGIVNGVGDGKFNPSGTITRQEAATMVARAAKLCGMDTDYTAAAARDILAQFGDYTKTADWARAPLAFCYDQGILDSSALNILPTMAIKRCEIAQMLYNMLEKANLL